MKTRTVIVEDEPIARAQLRDLVSGVEWIHCVGEAADGLTAVSVIESTRPDLVFLDIEMPELDGLGVLRRITCDPAVVFTTAYDKFAVAAFELEAIDYLLKPFGRDRLYAALDRVKRAVRGDGDIPVSHRAHEAIEQRDRWLTRIFVRDRGRLVPIAAADIERLEADDDYVAVHSRGRRYLVYLGMNEFEARLDPDRFRRIHRSHIVNLDHVASLTPAEGMRYEIVMRDGSKILASRTRSRELRGLAL
jgi:two-component system LytT family response regulator